MLGHSENQLKFESGIVNWPQLFSNDCSRVTKQWRLHCVNKLCMIFSVQGRLRCEVKDCNLTRSVLLCYLCKGTVNQSGNEFLARILFFVTLMTSWCLFVSRLFVLNTGVNILPLDCWIFHIFCFPAKEPSTKVVGTSRHFHCWIHKNLWFLL